MMVGNENGDPGFWMAKLLSFLKKQKCVTGKSGPFCERVGRKRL